MKIKLISETPPTRAACGPSITDDVYEDFATGGVVEVPESLAKTLIEVGVAEEVGVDDGV